MSLPEQRQKEKEKYESLLTTRPSYGTTNHGKGASEMVLDFIGDSEAVVVDCGCGDNSFIANISSDKIQGIGVDFVNPKADLIEPMHQISLEDNTADVVTSFDALEHLLPEEVEDVFKELKRIGKDGGMCIFSISYVPSLLTSLGEGLHPTVRDKIWWTERISQHCHNVTSAGKFLKAEWSKQV
jgi:SAM-dependent methyltransferase